jgi:TolB protein
MSRPDLDTRLIAWLDEQVPAREPDGLLDRVSADVAVTRRLPGWVLLERWIPMQTRARFGAASRAVMILALLGLLVASIAALGVASQSGPDPAPPFGLARNGLIAFDSAGDIWVADPDGTDPRVFVSGPGLDIDPTFSPDGTKLAFWSLEVEQDSLGLGADDTPYSITVSRMLGEGTASLMVTDVDGTRAPEPQPLVAGLYLDDLGGPPSWSPDSDALAYSYVGGGTSTIEIIPAEVGAVARRVTEGNNPSWSPDGSRLAYRSATLPYELMVVGVDGSDPHPVTAMSGPGFAFAMPQWSPDGDRIAVSVGAKDGPEDIWVVAADGTGETAVTTTDAVELWPYWSPDGSRLAFMQVADDNAGLVVSTAAETWPLARVDSDGLVGGAPVVWSPDGTRLVGFLQIPANKPNSDRVALLEVTDGVPSNPKIIDRPSPWQTASWQRLAP